MTPKLIYFVTRSLDRYIEEDEQGKIDWTAPDEERQQFVNDALRPVGTHLYGRRVYETMQSGHSSSPPSPIPHGRETLPRCDEQGTRSSARRR